MRVSIGINDNHTIERSAERAITIERGLNAALAEGDELTLYLGSEPIETVRVVDQLLEALNLVRTDALKELAGPPFLDGERVQLKGTGLIGRIVGWSRRLPELVQVQWPDESGPSTYVATDLVAYAEEQTESNPLDAGNHFAGMPIHPQGPDVGQLIHDAAVAQEAFGDDELERHAAALRDTHVAHEEGDARTRY